MAVIAGESQAVRGGGTRPKPPPLQNPWHIPNAQGNDIVSGRPAPPPPVVGQAAGPAPAAPAPPAPIDFNAETLRDPEYLRGQAQLAAQNTMTLKSLSDSFQRNRQSAYDNANARGALLSGAAVNAQGSLKDAYDNPVNGALAQQALNYDQGGSGLYFSVFNRLKAQLGNPGAIGGVAQ